jgi:hypothetical protein
MNLSNFVFARAGLRAGLKQPYFSFIGWLRRVGLGDFSSENAQFFARPT